MSAANPLGITLTAPPHVSQVDISILKLVSGVVPWSWRHAVPPVSAHRHLFGIWRSCLFSTVSQVPGVCYSARALIAEDFTRLAQIYEAPRDHSPWPPQMAHLTQLGSENCFAKNRQAKIATMIPCLRRNSFCSITSTLKCIRFSHGSEIVSGTRRTISRSMF